MMIHMINETRYDLMIAFDPKCFHFPASRFLPVSSVLDKMALFSGQRANINIHPVFLKCLLSNASDYNIINLTKMDHNFSTAC